MNPQAPNHALQRTAPCVTAPASAAAFPPTMQVPRRTPRSLSLRSLGVATRFMKTRHFRFFPLVIALLLSAGSFASAQAITKRPATVVGIHHEVRNAVPQHYIEFQFPSKSRARPDSSFKAFLDITGTSYFYVSPTGRRKKTSEAALKPGMRVLVTGFIGGVSGVSVAREINIPEVKP